MRPFPTHTLNPRVKFVWRITAFLSVFIPYVIFMASMAPLYFTISAGDMAFIFMVLATVTAVVLLILMVIVMPSIRFKYWRYEVGEHELDIARGFIWRKRFIIPFVRVQNTDTRQGPLLRLFGLSSVTVSTAADTHEIPGLNFEEADALRDLIAEQARLAQEDV